MLPDNEYTGDLFSNIELYNYMFLFEFCINNMRIIKNNYDKAEKSGSTMNIGEKVDDKNETFFGNLINQKKSFYKNNIEQYNEFYNINGLNLEQEIQYNENKDIQTCFILNNVINKNISDIEDFNYKIEQEFIQDEQSNQKGGVKRVKQTTVIIINLLSSCLAERLLFY